METNIEVWRNGKTMDSTICIGWNDKQLGFGEICICISNGRVLLDSENLDKETVKRIIGNLIDKMENG